MNFEFAFQILQLAVSLLRGWSSGAMQSDAALAQTLTEIVRIADQASRDHLGQPIDLSLINPETAI
jgi:hypothetical protein